MTGFEVDDFIRWNSGDGSYSGVTDLSYIYSVKDPHASLVLESPKQKKFLC